MSLFEGNCTGKAVNVEIGLDSNGKARVRWNMEVTKGDHKGKLANYSGKLDPDNIKWTKRDMMAIGWQGKDVKTFVADVEKAAREIPFTAEIADYNGRQWTSAKIGGAAPLQAPDRGTVDKLNGWFAEVGDSQGGGSDAPF